MTGILYVLYGVAAGVVILFIRAALFRPKRKKEMRFQTEEVAGARAVKNLQKLLRCRTVSYHDKAKEEDAEFRKLIALLPDLYPHVHKTCSVMNWEDRALLFFWKGKKHGKPENAATVFMAHFDVVPVEEARWEKPPFEGILCEGVLWGRGAIDTKVTFNGILSAAEELIREGFVPEKDIYLAFSGQEEVNGPAATWIVSYFETHGIKPGMVIDEGGAVVRDVFPGVQKPVALVGIAEKGLLDVSYTTDLPGGHASSPGAHTSVGILARAAARIEKRPFPMRRSVPVRQLFDALGREATFKYRLVFANMWCFAPVLDALTRKKGGELNALLRTTVAFTQMQGSQAPNVLPSAPYMRSNIRICPGDTIESVCADLRKKIHDPRVAVTVYGDTGMNPSPVSKVDGREWENLKGAIRSTWGDVLVSPYLMVQCSDSRHYRNISDRVYRFSAQALTAEERKTIHGDNERITVEQIEKSVMFFKSLMRRS